MLEKLRKVWQNEVFKFLAKTVFYFIIMFLLVYLYSYSGVDQPHFIYNEF
ncbi:teichoic acid D-Ala incorporation-associated protein DltX [Ligilactobacillus sp. Marseille-Q7487]|jgi:hypothetical protein|nr:teichoic acid D-Ala incorporation-associated protein DltX [Ligilactobacillus sp. Marseille-Q7487]